MPEEERSPALSRFALEVEALRESRMPAKVGALVPTYNRPDLLRACVLQLAAQSRPPDIICVHQNGSADSYRWAVEDLQIASQIAWLHTPAQLPQHQWYSIPLDYLVEQGCSHFFWCDHDDLYLRDHIARGLAELKDFDFSISLRCGVLVTRPTGYLYNPQVEFTSHGPGGMSSTMCFTRRFARELLADIEADESHVYTDQVIAHVTMPKFRCTLSQRQTAIYHAHEGAVTSNEWLPPV